MSIETLDRWRAAHRDLPGILAVAATYAYFLLFAQFCFLRLLDLRAAAAGEVQLVMASMGVAGLLASLATGRLLAFAATRRLLRIGFTGCAASALAALACRDFWAFAAVAALIGVAVGILTVALAADLRTLLCGRGFGLKVGLGTGLAYFLCNVPQLFEANPAVQGLVAALVAVAGLAALREPSPRAPEPAGREALARPATPPALRRRDYAGWGFASVVLSFLALIWLDSAAFAIIQETVALKGSTWGSPGQKLAIGGAHLLAAVAAGWLIDRGRFRSLLLAAFGLFGVAFALLEGAAGAAVSGPLYAVGISLYSVALVVYPAYWREEAGLVPRRWRAAFLYGICGWIGSALGIGMAQNLHHVPPLFLAATGLLLASGWALSRGLLSRDRLASLARAFGTSWAWGLAGLLLYAAVPEAGGPPPAAGTLTAIERGRRVYIAEGCIHCHSQYVRPRSRDVELWGPYRGAGRDAARPPLLGNRRQGPDLTNVGSRRIAAWQRVHLMDPQAVTPGSRMPSYAYLFAAEGSRGEDLVAYLDSLGREAPDRAEESPPS